MRGVYTTPESRRSRAAAMLRDALEARAVTLPRGVNLSCLVLLHQLMDAPVPVARSSSPARLSDVKEPVPGMGQCIKAGLACFVRDAQHYEITPPGRVVMQTLEDRGLWDLVTRLMAWCETGEGGVPRLS